MQPSKILCLSLGVSSLWACAEVTSEDPPSRLGAGSTIVTGSMGTPAGMGANSAAQSAGNQNPGNLAPGTSPNGGASPAPNAALPAAGSPGAAGGAARPSPSPSPAAVPPPAPTGPAGEVLLVDDFEDGDDKGWIADVADGDDLVGQWGVVTANPGHVYAQRDDSFSDESWSVGGDVRWTDVSVETRFRLTAADNIEDVKVMLALRFRSRDDYYYLEYGGNGSVKIRKRFEGSDDESSSDDLDQVATLGQWIKLRFVAKGSALSAYVDDKLVGSGAVDTDLTSGGIALGVQENAAVEFDDVRVTRP